LIGNGPAPEQLLAIDREAFFTRPDITENELLMLNLRGSRQLGAATIAFDIVFSEPDRTSLRQAAADLQKAGAEVILPVGQIPDNDAVLAEAFARNSVTAGFVVSSEASGDLPDPKAGFAFAGRDPQTFLASFSGGLSNLPTLSEAAQGLGFFSFPPSRDGVVRAIPLVARAAGKLVACDSMFPPSKRASTSSRRTVTS
jgi:CHASE2 domain-containing sensor protein